ncbi:MAG TPA: TAT-variant-translocated molybdopterin oxidoreductase [Kofleriaceae bacterium]|nr:TAT-variant-translocated molybdopterin oxidoreductase [Kofleriaceae bacterium]
MSQHGEHDHPDHDPDHPHEDNYDRAYAPSEPLPAPAPNAHGYWRSLAELEGKASFQEHPETATNEFPPAPVSDPLSRRNFFQLMGASMALAGVATGCRRYEKEEIVPLARRPEDQTPGQAQYYSTACELGGVGHALVATSFEGRPIKLDGNPDHPYASGGSYPATSNETNVRHAGCSTFVQASILSLYDPDRSQTVLAKGQGSTMDTFRAALAELRKTPAAIRVLAEASSSPTLQALKRRLEAAGGTWYEYEPLSWDNERAGTKLAFDKSVRPLAHLDRAETIVTIDCDLFVEHPAAMRYSRDFARSRRRNGSLGMGKMNRLWAIESTFSNTGAMADHRLGLRSELGLPIAMALDAALGGGSTANARFLTEDVKVKRFLDVLVKELNQNKGRAVVIAGRRQPPAVHALVARINERLGAVGATLDYVEDVEPNRVSHLEAITTLGRELAANKVETLVILGGNPVYDAPADLEFGKHLANVRNSIHLSEYVNETSQKCSWHVPKAHFLEAWGDTRTPDGTITLAQPLIAPLYGGVSSIELLSMILGEEKTGDQLVRDTHTALGMGWREAVEKGFLGAAQPTYATVSATRAITPPPLSASQQGGTGFDSNNVEVAFHYSSFSYDGRFANNAWLQETPDFLTKVVWDNYALVGPETAEQLGLANDTMITVKIGDRSVDVACYTMPGQARGSIGLVLGGGRTAAGRVGGIGSDHRVGWDTYKVRTTQGFDYATNATVSSTGKKYALSSTQEHWDIRTGLKPDVQQKGIAERLPELVRETTNQELGADKTWRAEPGVELYWDDTHVDTNGAKRHLSLFREKEYAGHRWGMAIDLSTCTGCNACMVACQNENNVPVVGRQEVANNREMHWIRIDRYFGGTKEDPVVVHQPIACQQCENAPCEQVCPVGATVHSDEGLNDMTYNRCIGTRYCANNCPYKVRRFNFLDWNKEWREARNKVRRLLFNPEVTVRMRGVMEKCTFCVQRIQNAKIHAKALRRNDKPGAIDAPLPDGQILTACQQACPTETIIFGDLSDPNSRVSRAHADQRQYALLPEQYTKPRNRFLARVRNPNPELVPPSAATHGAGHGAAPIPHGEH